jgi:hypothetical protein
MKFLNTKYAELFDSTTYLATDSTYSNVIQTTNYNYSSYAYFNVIDRVSTKTLYFKFGIRIQGNNEVLIANIRTINNGVAGSNLIIYSTNSTLRISNANATFNQTFNVPSTTVTSKNYSGYNQSYYQRKIMIYFNTTQNYADIYSDGVLIGTVNCDNNNEDINTLVFGTLNASPSSSHYLQLFDIIISNDYFSPVETVTEVSPTITTTDWGIVNSYANSDTVGDVMTLTSPANAIDETKRTVTGYSVLCLNSTISPTVNAINVTQGINTIQFIVPDNSTKTLNNTFTVSQLNDISATVTSSYVSP